MTASEFSGPGLSVEQWRARADCGVDYEEAAAGWAAAVLPLLVPDAPSGTGKAAAGVRAEPASAPRLGADPVAVFDKRRIDRASLHPVSLH